jgi:hypothetical protein
METWQRRERHLFDLSGPDKCSNCKYEIQRAHASRHNRECPKMFGISRSLRALAARGRACLARFSFLDPFLFVCLFVFDNAFDKILWQRIYSRNFLLNSFSFPFKYLSNLHSSRSHLLASSSTPPNEHYSVV